MSDDPVTKCEVCGAPVERVFHPVAVHFKGSGFYSTDYGRNRGGGGSDSTRAPRTSPRRRRRPRSPRLDLVLVLQRLILLQQWRFQVRLSSSSASSTTPSMRASSTLAWPACIPDVNWPNMIEGGREHGHAAVKAYWQKQFETTDPRVEPERVTPLGDDQVVVDVHQVVTDKSGQASRGRRHGPARLHAARRPDRADGRARRLESLAVVAALLAGLPTAAEARTFVAGRSVEGRAIKVQVSGAADAPVRVLVVGSIHGIGDCRPRRDPAATRVARAGRRAGLDGAQSVNPDGARRGTRQNARGVDLNRNFPHRWRRSGRPFSTYHSGPRPLSEPETRAVRRLVRRVRPHVTIWYHQHMRLVDLGSGAEPALVRAYARRVGLPARHIGFLPGVATRWQNARFAGVQRVRGRAARRAAVARARPLRHARAALAVGRLAPRRPRRRRRPCGSGASRSARSASARCAGYARRHYGIDDYRLRDPRVDRAAPVGHRHGGAGVQHVRSQPSRPRAGRAAQRLRALRGRPRGARSSSWCRCG